MENFIGKVIKIVSGDKGVSKDYWIDDSKCKACYECETAFSQWNRRHHCRICGRVFCGNCTRNSIPPPRESADQQWLRVCNYCYRVRQRSDQPAVRQNSHHAGSRGVGAAALCRSGNLRHGTDAGSPLGIPSSDGSSSSVARSRVKSSASTSRWPRGQSSVHRVSTGDLSWTVPPPLEDDFGMSLGDRDARLLYQQHMEAGALPPDAPSQANSLADVHRQLLCAAADAHLRAVVQQLLMVESVPQPEVWAPIVSGAAQAVAAYLSPSQMYANSQHDPRQSLKVKKVADVGRPDDTGVVTGVVVRKGLVHRKMRAYIEYPKVLLLAGSLEYQRETNKLSSFDLMDHDKQYLANAVARLSVVKPDVVLVEGSVARMAQEDLLSRNISVAQKIKAKVLERLARAMGVRVTPTVEHLTTTTAHLYLGDCKVFRVEAETINYEGSKPSPPTSAAIAPTAPTSSGPLGVSACAGPSGVAASACSASSATGASPIVSRAGTGEPAQVGQAALDAQRQGLMELQVPVDQGATTPGAQAQECAQAVNLAASKPEVPVPPRPVADEQQAKYTSLSAAMMMKALGSGPNAAAAVALVSAGSGVATGSIPFRSWASSVPTASVEAVPPGSGGTAPSALAGGQGTPVSDMNSAATVTPAVLVAPGPSAGPGRTTPVPVPAGPPPPPQVTLMYFEGCRPTTATVLLKGVGLDLLRKLKPVVGFAVLTAWNQRLESAFLADLLTAAVASAGEEAYAAWAAATSGVTSCSSFQATPSLGPSSSHASATPTYLSHPLSLGFFRQHAEQAIRTSVAAASAWGVPGILLSISPHCNAWDESLIAEWEQQGFSFRHLPHRHHHHDHGHDHRHHDRHHGYGHGHSLGQVQKSQSMLEAILQHKQQPQQPVSEVSKVTDNAACQTSGAALPEASIVSRSTAKNADGSVQRELSYCVMPNGNSSEPRLIQLQTGAEMSEECQVAATAASNSTAAEDPLNQLHQPNLVPMVSATTLMSAFIATTTALSASARATVPKELILQLESDAGRAPSGAAVANNHPNISEEQQDASVTATRGQGDCSLGPTAGTSVGTDAAIVNDDLRGTENAGPGTGTSAATGELGAQVRDKRVTPQPHADPGQPGDEDREQQQQPRLPQQEHNQSSQQQSSQRQSHQQQQQDAVMVLQGKRIYNHQRIFVTCMFRRSRDRNLCDPFQVKQIDYYHRSSDVPLIRYIKMCTQMGWTCPGPGCPDPFTAHESVFFVGCHKLTIFYSTLPPIQALPGEEKNQIWHWTRPIGRGREGAAACRRVPLSQDACYISMGRFLELSFSADGLDVFGRSLHYDHVRYFGLGRTMVCMFPERTSVYVMQLPDVIMEYSQQAQTKWLRQGGGDLIQEASDAFDLIELMLMESPHFSGGNAAAVPVSLEPADPAQGIPVIGDVAAGDSVATATANGASTSCVPGSLPNASAGTACAAASPPLAMQVSSVLTPLLVAVRKDRQSFLTLVADCLNRCAKLGPPQSSSAGVAVPWDELVISGVRELNRLRTVLAKAVLQWASRLQDPVGFMAHYSRVTSGGGGAGRLTTKNQPQLQLQPQPPTQQSQAQPHAIQSVIASSPRESTLTPTTGPVATSSDAGPASTAVACVAAATSSHPPQALLDQPSLTASDGSLSLFSSASPTAAAYRLGLLPGPGGIAVPPSENTSFTSTTFSDIGTEHLHHHHYYHHQHQAADTAATHSLPIPIVPHTNGPLSVHAVAEMVAQQELRGGGELLEGSRALLGAAGGPAAAAASVTAVATQQATTWGAPGHSRGGSRTDLPIGSIAVCTSGLAAEGSGANVPPALLGHGDGDAAAPSGRSSSQPSGPALAGGGASSKRLSALGRISTGGGVVSGLDASTTVVGLVGVGQGGGALGVGAVPRGASLPRSASVSTIGDMGDLSYMGMVGGDSGVEDNEDGEDGREDPDDEEPDHDTFLAFVGSGPHGGGAAFPRTVTGRGHGGSTAGDRTAVLGIRGDSCGDSSDDVPDEMADGAYYYRALFSHGIGGEMGAGEALSQPLVQPLQPLLPTQPLQLEHMQKHPLQPQVAGPEQDRQQRQVFAANEQQSFLVPYCASPQSACESNGTTGLAAQPPSGAGPGGPNLSGHVPVSEPTPLVPAVETFGSAAGTSLNGSGVTVAMAATTFSRRQLMLQVKQRLESVTAATSGGSALARGFIPLPGRATLPPGVNDTIIPIFDAEPTSIIAYALSTRAYQQQINAGYKAIFGKARADTNREREAASLQPQVPVVVVLEQQQQSAAVGGVQVGSQGMMAGVSSSGTGTFCPGHSAGPVVAGGQSTGVATAPGQIGNGASPSVPSLLVASLPSSQPPSTVGNSTSVFPTAAAPSQQPLPPPPTPPPTCPLNASPDAEWWTVLTSKEACHVRVAFEDEARSMPWARARFTVAAHFAPQFAELRRRCIQGGEAAFVASMCRCKRWESRGGKSNAYFAKTRDDRYIIKSLSKSEKASFMNFAPHYFAHMGRHLLNRDSPTCLAKILGVYSVAFKPQPGTAGIEGAGFGGPMGAATSAALIKELKDREFSQDLLVMENCFYDRPVARIYDLKGSERNRFNADAASRPEDHLEVHLDDNLRRTMHTNPIFVDARSRHQMEAAVWADTSFLAGQDVMDYSLLVGVDKENGVLALAIIDFIRQYTWDKQLETWVKSSGMLGGNGKEPTIISPKQYMRRFRTAMQQYFTAVPGSAGSEVPKDPDAVA